MDMDEDELQLSTSAPGSNDAGARNSRLARKAESARQARLRHKQFVTDLTDQVTTLQQRVRTLEAHGTAHASGYQSISELKRELRPEQLAQLHHWLHEAHGENHALNRYAVEPPPPPPSALDQPEMRSMPMPIGSGDTPRQRGISPMESDEDTVGISRSWDDIEGARSILNLNSPNGFHPALSGPLLSSGASFSLGAAASPQTTFGQGSGTSFFGTTPLKKT